MAPPQSNALVLGPFDSINIFRDALPEAVLWGSIALGVGLAGFLLSLLLVLAHTRDQASLRRGQGKPAEYRAPRWGPLYGCLREFFADPLHIATLSPDAASEYVTGRLDAQHDVTNSIVRYFSYAPLLLGLMGTAFALRALLITSGSTLQEIQPQLSGVFAGTLAGIGGSLLAAVGGLVLDRVALSTANQSQDFIHRFILPTLPERRIAVRIEDAVLNVIAERAQAVAEKFHNTLQPVATELKEIADRCGEAAEAATKAFSEAARAVRDAGDLGNAARNFKSGAHMLDSSAEQFLAATKQTAEIVLRSGDLRASLSGLLERFQGVSQNLGSASERVGSQLAGQLAELKPHGQKLDTSVSALHSAMEALSTELVRRADADSAQLETAKTFVELSGRQMGDLARITQQTSDSVNVLRTALDTIDQKTLEAIRSEVNPLIIESMQQTKSALESLPGIFERHIETLSTQLTDSKPLPTRPDIDGVHDLAAALRDAVSEVKLASGAAARLADQLKQLDSNPEITTKKGIFQRFWNRGSDG